MDILCIQIMGGNFLAVNMLIQVVPGDEVMFHLLYHQVLAGFGN